MCDAIKENGKCCGECERQKQEVKCYFCHDEFDTIYDYNIIVKWCGTEWNVCRKCDCEIPASLEFLVKHLISNRKDLRKMLDEAIALLG
jgi:hypothetical protein